MRFLRVLWKSLMDFFRDDGLTLAGSMSYFTMMAFVPLCLFLLTVFGGLLGRYPEFLRFFTNRLTGLFPEATGAMTQEIMKLISYHGIGKVSLLLYGFISYRVFASIENSMNIVFKVKEKRNIFLSLLLSLVLVTFIIAIVMASFAAASAMPLLSELREYFPNFRLGKLARFIIRYVLPFFMVLFTVAMIYKLIPMVKVKTANAFKGAIFTAVFMEAAKYAFTWYVLTIAPFGKIYGSLTALIVFLLWMFYSSSIFLIGAEMVHNLDKPVKSKR